MTALTSATINEHSDKGKFIFLQTSTNLRELWFNPSIIQSCNPSIIQSFNHQSSIINHTILSIIQSSIIQSFQSYNHSIIHSKSYGKNLGQSSIITPKVMGNFNRQSSIINHANCRFSNTGCGTTGAGAAGTGPTAAARGSGTPKR